jgi:hypothetical protein
VFISTNKRQQSHSRPCASLRNLPTPTYPILPSL